MCNTPLFDYFAFGGDQPEFAVTCTALWRGYIGTWEILDDRLYLIKLSGVLKDGTEACLWTIFPDFPDRVFAHWYSGMLRIHQGKLLEYVHQGFESTYEENIIIHINNGLISTPFVQQTEN